MVSIRWGKDSRRCWDGTSCEKVMNRKNDEFQKRLLLTFKVEAEEHVKALTADLLELERDLPDESKMEIIERMFREAHSLKGAARSVGTTDVESICQSAEGVFSALKRKKINLHPALFDTLHRVFDTINEIVFSPEGVAGTDAARISEIRQLLTKIEAGESFQCTEPHGQIKEPVARQIHQSTETIRIATDKMANLLTQVEEMIWAKLFVAQHTEDINYIISMCHEWERAWSRIYPEMRGLRRGQAKEPHLKSNKTKSNTPNQRLLEFIDVTRNHMKLVESRLFESKKQAERNRYTVGVMIDSLLEDVKKTLMVPFLSLFETFPKTIRDLAHEQGKKVELTVSGEEIEIDRRILEEMRIPFVHLIRNSIDHGIERPEERLKNGKPGAGNIKIAVSTIGGNKVEILFADDGLGIDVEKVKEISVKQGIVSEKEQCTEQETLYRVFQSGISTSPIITDISGRGLGLAIVKEKIEQLGGRMSMESRRNKGVSFKMVIPLFHATFRGVLVKVLQQVFVIPTTRVERVMRIGKDEIKTVENRETISLDGTTVALTRLADVLELSRTQEESYPLHTVIIGSSGRLIGFVVDEVLDEHEILTKNLNQYLSRIRNVAGTTILGSGQIVPILNVSDLIKSAMRSGSSSLGNDNVHTEKERKSILVVEDSITSRMLLRNILETSGYLVKTAVDGVDAITRLKSETFDLVVSDVDMPRMNGFDLTSKIRSQEKLSKLPVVLVTALESPADKERGIDVGANAYIVKSSFGQSSLLDIIRKLI